MIETQSFVHFSIQSSISIITNGPRECTAVNQSTIFRDVR